MPFFVATRGRRQQPRLLSLARWTSRSDVMVVVGDTPYNSRVEAEQSVTADRPPNEVAIIEAENHIEATRSAFAHFTGEQLPRRGRSREQ